MRRLLVKPFWSNEWIWRNGFGQMDEFGEMGVFGGIILMAHEY